jgi:hypothetical protein
MNAVAVIVLALAGVTQGTDPDPSVVAGRRALDHWWRYPWYDAASDGIRRVEIDSPKDPGDGPELPEISTPWLQTAAWIVLAILLVGLAYYLVRAYLLRERSGGESAGHGDEASQTQRRIEALNGPTALGDLLAAAERHYRDGRYREAIICLFGHELVELDKRQLIRLAKGKTNRQYLRELGPRRALQQLVGRTVVAFEDVFFGNRPIDRARFESCWLRLTEFDALVREMVG